MLVHQRVTDMLTGSVTQSRSPCSPDALSICCCPANSWADPRGGSGEFHISAHHDVVDEFLHRDGDRYIYICIYIYIHVCILYMYIYIYVCVCDQLWMEKHIIRTLIHKMVHSDPKKSLQATPGKTCRGDHPRYHPVPRHRPRQGTQPNRPTSPHEAMACVASHRDPLWSPDSFQLVTDHPRWKPIKEEK